LLSAATPITLYRTCLPSLPVLCCTVTPAAKRHPVTLTPPFQAALGATHDMHSYTRDSVRHSWPMHMPGQRGHAPLSNTESCHNVKKCMACGENFQSLQCHRLPGTGEALEIEPQKCTAVPMLQCFKQAAHHSDPDCRPEPLNITHAQWVVARSSSLWVAPVDIVGPSQSTD
jgi:hypothetical protein